MDQLLSDPFVWVAGSVSLMTLTSVVVQIYKIQKRGTTQGVSPFYVTIILGLFLFGFLTAHYYKNDLLVFFYGGQYLIYAILSLYILIQELRWNDENKDITFVIRDKHQPTHFYEFRTIASLIMSVVMFVQLVLPVVSVIMFVIWMPFPLFGLYEQVKMLRDQKSDSSLSGIRLALDAGVSLIFLVYGLSEHIWPQATLSALGVFANSYALHQFITITKQKKIDEH